MKVYKVTYHNHSDSSQGFSFHSSLAEAKKKVQEFKKEEGDNYFDINEDGGITVIEVEISKRGILAVLNAYASHPDNG